MQQEQNTHSSQIHVKHSTRQNTFWDIKHTLTNLKEEKSYKLCS